MKYHLLKSEEDVNSCLSTDAQKHRPRLELLQRTWKLAPLIVSCLLNVALAYLLLSVRASSNRSQFGTRYLTVV